MLKIDNETRSRLHVNVLKILKTCPYLETSEDVQKNAWAELFLRSHLPPEWTTARLLSLAEWIERAVLAQLAESSLDALRIDAESCYALGDAVGHDVARESMALAGVFETSDGWFFGNRREAESRIADGAIPPYRPN